ncbi:hypothetical protein BKI52_21510 [marine bacterium AO1-C]|nr:hypothetical protein BKI52_21510 [marine bacterium AO1-C]
MPQTIANILGQKLCGISLKKSEFISSKNEIIADEIVFHFDEIILQIRPLSDTDELQLSILDSPPNNTILYNYKGLNNFIGKQLVYTWKGINSQGYFDLFTLAFEYITPNISIVCEGSALKILIMKSI